MSDIILTRDSFINEIYSHSQQNELNEGIFDVFKTIAKKEWKDIKSKNSEIKEKLEAADRGLGGFTLMKIKKSGACKEIRQLLCDFANKLWESKEKEIEDGKKLQKMLMGLKDKDKVSDEDVETVNNSGKVSNYMKDFNIKDKALLDTLKNIEKRIKVTCKGDPELTRWTDILKLEIRNIINDLILNEYEKIPDENKKDIIKKKREEVKKQKEEQKKEAEEADKKAKEKEKKQIKEIEKDRTDALSKVGVTPIKNQSGDKTFNTLNTKFQEYLDEIFPKSTSESKHVYSFENLINEKKKVDKEYMKIVKDILGDDVYFGFNNIQKLKGINDTNIHYILKELKIIYNVIKEAPEIEKRLKNVPGDAVQALYVGLSELVQHAVTDGKLDDNIKNLLARCAITKDKTLGYGLPLFDPKNPKTGNMIVAIASTLADAKKPDAFDNNQEEFNKFKQNITKMFNEVQKTAEELMDKRKQEDEQEAKQVEKEDNK